MNSNLIFWPVLTQIALTLVGFMILGIRKAKAIRTKNVDRQKAALDNDAWPDYVLQVSNNIRNQFQIPVLFYVLCFISHSLGVISYALLSLAWAFVVSRVVHAYVHMTSNYVPARFGVFTIGFVILLLMFMLAAGSLITNQSFANI